MEGFVNLVNMHDSSSSDRTMSIQRRSASTTSGLLAPAAQTSAGRASCSCIPWPAAMRQRPHRPLLLPPLAQGIPLLIHTPCYSAATAASHRNRTSEPSYSSPRGHPLSRLPRLRVIPFIGLAVVPALVLSACCGQHGQGTASIGRGPYVERLTAGSTAAARKCLLIMRKIMIPPPDIRDPPKGPLYFVKKTLLPLTARTHQL